MLIIYKNFESKLKEMYLELNETKDTSPLNRLFHKIFVENEYSKLVRPILESYNGITRIETELKLLNIDLV